MNNMIKSTFVFALLMLVWVSANGQSNLYLPRDLRAAYEKGTRSLDGNPGRTYWQNRASYTINASFDPGKHRLEGEETVQYVNNSPDTVRILRIKLDHDLYKKGGPREETVDPADVDDGTKIEQISINGKNLNVQDQRRYATFMDIRLNNGWLLPRESVSLHVKWSYTMPAAKNATRECVCDASSFFVAYWYPQIGVYDDLHGWVTTPYNGLTEFYNDFSNYYVTLTFPKGYMVWATGEWQNALEMLETPVFDKWNNAHTSAEVVSIFTEADLKNGGIFKKARQHVFRYKATDVPDFAFAASDHYNWDASSVVVDRRTGRRTFVSAAYNSSSKDFYKVARIAANGIKLMSNWLPGYPFPYPCETVFNGNDGMEYPMMVNDATEGSGDPTNLTVHEVSHTYFPFMMGINEQHYAWMDEGWASFFDFKLTDSLNNGGGGDVRGYSFTAGNESDVPPMVLSNYLNGTAYYTGSYARPQSAYLALLDLLGYDTFHKCMTEYMNRWKGKHPTPYDFFTTWNNVSGQNLDWFWKPWFYDWGYPDLAISGVGKTELSGNQEVVIEKKGSIPVPVHLEVEYSDGTKSVFHQNASVWQDGKSKIRIPVAPGKTIKNAVLGDRTIPDVNRKDNSVKN
jgi:hypothetical protein